MKKLRVVYDPDMGLVVPDNKVAKEVDSIINLASDGATITVGSEIFLNEFRIATLKGKASVTLVLCGVDCPVLESGRLREWPTSFRFTMEHQLMTLLGVAERFKK